MARRRARPPVRLVALLGAFALTLVAVVGRLVQLQIVRAQPLELLGARQRVRAVEIPAERGSIYDRNGTPLAVSVEARAIYADARAIDNPPLAAAALAPILGTDPLDLIEKLSRRTSFVYLSRGVAPAVAERVLALRLPFIGSVRESRREYPDGSLAGQVLGFVGTDHTGLSGLESRYETHLRGRSGQAIVEEDPAGRPIPQGRRQIRAPVRGSDLVLSIDERIQYATERALASGVAATRSKDGMAIVLDPRTGDVLAMANWPPLDPNRFDEVSAERQRNRALTDAYEPGSVNKVITASAAIAAGLMTPETRMAVPPTIRVSVKTFHEAHPRPRMTMSYADAIARSSNIATIQVALKLGKQRLHDALRRFGLGAPAGIAFPGESSGILFPARRWSGTDIGAIAIGQGVAASPMQVAQVYATIANGGVRMKPRLVRAIVGPDGRTRGLPPSKAARTVDAYVAAQVRSMLVGVVEHGTGRRAQIPSYVVGGKTGTARVPRADGRGYTGDVINTFVGFAPAEHPRLVVLVALNNPAQRFASVTTAPVFREIMRFALARLGVPPTTLLHDAAMRAS